MKILFIGVIFIMPFFISAQDSILFKDLTTGNSYTLNTGGKLKVFYFDENGKRKSKTGRLFSITEERIILECQVGKDMQRLESVIRASIRKYRIYKNINSNAFHEIISTLGGFIFLGTIGTLAIWYLLFSAAWGGAISTKGATLLGGLALVVMIVVVSILINAFNRTTIDVNDSEWYIHYFPTQDKQSSKPVP